MSTEKKYIITESQRAEVLTALLEMQAKYSYNVLQVLGTLPELVKEEKLKPLEKLGKKLRAK